MRHESACALLDTRSSSTPCRSLLRLCEASFVCNLHFVNNSLILGPKLTKDNVGPAVSTKGNVANSRIELRTNIYASIAHNWDSYLYFILFYLILITH